MSTWIALFILALGGILLVSDSSGLVTNLDANTFGYMVAGLAVLVFLGGGMVVRYGGHLGPMVRDLVIWAALGLGLITLYTYRQALAPIAGRVMAELIPGEAIVISQDANGHAEVRLHRGLSGHFNAIVNVNGKRLDMIVDTGATTVVLNERDARAIGINTRTLRYNIPVMTANGTAMAAPIHLREVAIGPLQRRDVSALVTQKGALAESLLGMSFLSRLKSYEFSGDSLTLRG